jgi:hypothetical protein
LEQIFAAVRNTKGAEATAAQPVDHPGGIITNKRIRKSRGLSFDISAVGRSHKFPVNFCSGY